MNGDNGRGTLAKERRVRTQDRLTDRSTGQPAGRPGPDPDQAVDRLAERIGTQIRQDLDRRWGPRFEEMENKLEDLGRRLEERPRPQDPPPSQVPADRQAIQRQARNRVD